MKIRYHQSGGVAGLAKAVELDTATLSESEAHLVIQMALASKMEAQATGERKAFPDQEVIRIEIIDEFGSQEIISSRNKASANVKPLVDYLAPKAAFVKR